MEEIFIIPAYRNSIELLKKASTPFGFVAAIQEQDNYKRVWTRDGAVNTIAALMSGDAELIATAYATIDTMFAHQHATGFMPSNVVPGSNVTSFGGTVGRADNPSWAVIALCSYTLFTGDNRLLEKYAAQVEKCFAVLDAWEFNGSHLIYVPQSGDWADEYIQHGYILFGQLLRVWALRLAARVYARTDWQQKADAIVATIQANYWGIVDATKLYALNLTHHLTEAPGQYWLMGFNPSRIYTYFDLQANALALLLGIGTNSQNETLLAYVESLYTQHPAILPSFHPAILETDKDMQELKTNYAYAFRNYPHQFHNGGLWPVWNGFMAMALSHVGKQELAKKLVLAIHEANSQDDNGFNECLNGVNRTVCGIPHCAWSAGGAVIAEKALADISFKQLFQ